MGYLVAVANSVQVAAQGAAQGAPSGSAPTGMNGTPPTGMNGTPPSGLAGGPGGGPGGSALFGPIGTYVVGGLFLVTLVILVIVFWKLFKKAGKPGALGLLMAIPVVNLGVGLWIAFTTWPIEKEAERARLLAAAAAAEAAENAYPYDAAGQGMPVAQS